MTQIKETISPPTEIHALHSSEIRLPMIQKPFPNLSRLIKHACVDEYEYYDIFRASQKYVPEYLAWQAMRFNAEFIQAPGGLEPTGLERYWAKILDPEQIAREITDVASGFERSIRNATLDRGAQRRMITALEDPNQELNAKELAILSSVFGACLARLRMVPFRYPDKQQLANDTFRRRVKTEAMKGTMIVPNSLKEVDLNSVYTITLPFEPTVSEYETPDRRYMHAARLGMVGHPMMRATLDLISTHRLRAPISEF